MSRITKYKPEYCALLIRHMAEGLTFGSFAGVVKVNRDTVFEWANKFPEFAEAKSLGEAELMLWDEKLLRGLTAGKVKGQIVGQFFKMKNCHPHTWREKLLGEDDRTITHKGEVAVKQALSERIKQLKGEK